MRDAIRRRATGPPKQRRDQTGGIVPAVGQRAQSPHVQQRGTVGIDHVIGERMGDTLIRANGLAKRLTFAGIGGSHLDGFTRQSDQRCRSQQLPLFDPGCPDRRGIALSGKHQPFALTGHENAQRCATKRQRRFERPGRYLDCQFLTVERQDAIGHCATRHKLGFAVGHTAQGQGQHNAFIARFCNPFARHRAAILAKHSQRDERFRQRYRCQPSSGLLHHQAGIEQAHITATGIARDPHERNIERKQVFPQLRIKPDRLGRAHACRGGFGRKEALEHVLHGYAVVWHVQLHLEHPFASACMTWPAANLSSGFPITIPDGCGMDGKCL